MTDRFDFEQQIMSCWSVCEDMKAVTRMHDLRPLTEDELLNALIGLETIYQMKFEVLFDMFEQMVKSGQIK